MERKTIRAETMKPPEGVVQYIQTRPQTSTICPLRKRRFKKDDPTVLIDLVTRIPLVPEKNKPARTVRVHICEPCAQPVIEQRQKAMDGLIALLAERGFQMAGWCPVLWPPSQGVPASFPTLSSCDAATKAALRKSFSGMASKVNPATSTVRHADVPQTEQQGLLPTLAPSHSSIGFPAIQMRFDSEGLALNDFSSSSLISRLGSMPNGRSDCLSFAIARSIS